MSTISRKLPNSNVNRQKALDKAFNKMTSPGPDGNILSAGTTTRLTAAQAAYNLALRAVNTTGADANAATNTKTTAKTTCYNFVSGFIQSFNIGVKIGTYPASDRRFYHLDETSDALPPMESDDDLTEAGRNTIDGEADRITAGGTAHPFPLIAAVTIAYDDFVTKNLLKSAAAETLDNAQEDVDDLNIEADKVIKKIWDEAETFYNEETPESMRENARQWGVVYVTTGNIKPVTIHVINADGTDAEGKLVEFDEGGTKVTTNAQGKALFNTTIEGPGNFSVDGVAFPPFNILPDEPQEFGIQLP